MFGVPGGGREWQVSVGAAGLFDHAFQQLIGALRAFDVEGSFARVLS
ncbi:hypothetical protein ACDH50_16740 [Xanthomonas fragariae]|nr:hypothetical protein [Xanthomonas fragariae]